MCFVVRDVVIQDIFGGSALYSFKSRDILDKVWMPQWGTNIVVGI